MERKFTEGEWVVEGDLICLGFNPSDAVVCDINPYLDEYISVFEYSEQEARANAKLIASAPDLLNRLNSIVLSVKAHPDYVNGEEGDEWHDIVELAEQTIKKATK